MEQITVLTEKGKTMSDVRPIDANAYISHVFMELAKAIEEDTAPDIAIALATKIAECIKKDITDETIKSSFIMIK